MSYQLQTFNQYDARFRQPYLNGLANDTTPPTEGVPTQEEMEEMVRQQMRAKGYPDACITKYLDMNRRAGGDPANLSAEDRAWAEKVSTDPSACNGASGGSFFTQDVDIFGAQIPVWALLLAGAAGTWYFLSD